MKLLLIDDDIRLGQAIQHALSKDYFVDIAHNADEGLFFATDSCYDLLLVDVGLPDQSGIELVKLLRRKEPNMPIMMLTGDSDVSTKVNAFDMGADEYVTKPFHPAELIARMKALMRRKDRPYEGSKICIGDLTIQLEQKRAVRDGKIISLRKKEYEILYFLANNLGKVVSRDTLIAQIWGNASELYDNTVDVYINYLRKKIDKPYEKKMIQTIHGFGYRLVWDDK